eukprot:1129419-Pyramimonas_sp.AAC.1
MCLLSAVEKETQHTNEAFDDFMLACEVDDWCAPHSTDPTAPAPGSPRAVISWHVRSPHPLTDKSTNPPIALTTGLPLLKPRPLWQSYVT